MNPLIFALGIAEKVLSSVIVDLVTGKRNVAQKKEVERLVNAELLQYLRQENQELKLLTYKILTEIQTLASHDPNLVVSQNQIKLVRPQLLQSSTDGQLETQLGQLEHIVTDRKEEIRKRIITVQFQRAVQRTIDNLSKEDKIAIEYNIFNQSISRMDISALDVQNRCRAQLTFEVDWRLHKTHAEKYDRKIEVPKNWAPDGTAIETDEMVMLFNKYVNHYSLYPTWQTNLMKLPRLSWVGNKIHSNYTIPELPELKVKITLTE